MRACRRYATMARNASAGSVGRSRWGWTVCFDARPWASENERGAGMSRYSAITGWGMHVPEKIMTNADFEKIIDTSDEWITSRTGIKQRHMAGPGESASTLAIAAG